MKTDRFHPLVMKLPFRPSLIDPAVSVIRYCGLKIIQRASGGIRGWIAAMLVTALSMHAAAQEIPLRAVRYRPGDWIGYPVMRYVTSIALGNTNVYFGTTNGISRYDFYSDRWGAPFTRSDGLADDRIRAVAYDFDSGTLWCATEAGLSYRISSAEEWRNLSYDDAGTGYVNAIGSGRRYIWLESSDGLCRGDRFLLDFREGTEQEESEDEVRWNGGRAGGPTGFPDHLFVEHGYFYFPEGLFQDRNLRQFAVTETLSDEYFNLWMGTWGLGVGVADLRTSSFSFLPFGPYTSRMDFMAWDGGGMWMGGQPAPEESGGVTWWDMEENEWTYFEAVFLPGFRSDAIQAIAADTAYVWFGTDEGLSLYDKREDAWRTFDVHDNLWDNRVTTMAMGDAVLWVGTASGINRVSLPLLEIRQVRAEALIHRTVYHLEVDGDEVWAATDRGLYRYLGAEDVWVYVPGYLGMTYLEAFAVSVWEDEVWVGAEDGVQVYYKEKNEWRGYPERHHPTGGFIHTILADSAVVWVGTDEGLLKYVKEEDRWRRFTIEDGLLDDAVFWILPDGDYLWLGTRRGLTRFYWNAPYRID